MRALRPQPRDDHGQLGRLDATGIDRQVRPKMKLAAGTTMTSNRSSRLPVGPGETRYLQRLRSTTDQQVAGIHAVGSQLVMTVHDGCR